MDILLAILNRPEFYQLYCMRFFFVESIYDLDQPGHSSDNIRGGFNNPFITLTTNALGFYVICQTKDQSVAVIMVQETFFLSLSSYRLFKKLTNIHCIHFLPNCKDTFNKNRKAGCIF